MWVADLFYYNTNPSKAFINHKDVNLKARKTIAS
jgi:hypothetical protein